MSDTTNKYIQQYAVFNKDYQIGSSKSFKKDQEFPVYGIDGYEVSVSCYTGNGFYSGGFSIYTVPANVVTVSSREISPRFNVGDSVRHSGSNIQPFKISSIRHEPKHGTFWFQNEWGDRTGLANGAYEFGVEAAE